MATRGAARRLEIPAECALSNEEIARGITLLHQRKLTTEGLFDVEAALGDGITVKVAADAAITKQEIIGVLTLVNRAKIEENADVTITYQNGVIVKNHINLKPDPIGRPRAGGERMPKDF